ncbi:DNA-binding protein [bacterium]|nr:DNA-binding protein [bacterium]
MNPPSVPTLASLGNSQLRALPWTAFFCSVRCPGTLILQAYDLAHRFRAANTPVIGGFHSPVEKEVLRILLCSTAPVCLVLARSLPRRVPADWRRPLADDRLLVLSPFGDRTRRATAATAAHRNAVVAGLATRVVVAYAAPGGKTEGFCRAVVASGKPCLTLADPHTAHLVGLGFGTGPHPS